MERQYSSVHSSEMNQRMATLSNRPVALLALVRGGRFSMERKEMQRNDFYGILHSNHFLLWKAIQLCINSYMR